MAAGDGVVVSAKERWMMDDFGDLNWLFSQHGFTLDVLWSRLLGRRKAQSIRIQQYHPHRRDWKEGSLYGRKGRGILLSQVNARLDGEWLINGLT